MRKGYRREIFIAVVCVASFFVGLSMVTEVSACQPNQWTSNECLLQGGIYVFLLFDYYSGSRIILLVAFFECIAVAYIYGARRFYDNLTMMLGYKMFPAVKFAWLFVTPVFTLVCFIMQSIDSVYNQRCFGSCLGHVCLVHL
jgi:solute carrier family 6 GABA transporter-like protein 6/8/11/12/13